MKEYKVLEKLIRFLEAEGSDLENDPRKTFVGAAALDSRGNIVSIRSNSFKTHPKMARYAQITGYGPRYKIYLHAEVAALVSSGVQVDTLIVARLRRDGQLALAKPCPICQLAIKEAKVRRVFFTNNTQELVLLN